MIIFIDDVVLSINTQNDPYELKFMIVSYFSDTFLNVLILFMTIVCQPLSKIIGINSLVVNYWNSKNIPSVRKEILVKLQSTGYFLSHYIQF